VHEVKSFAAYLFSMINKKYELKRRYDATADIYDRRYEEIQRKKYEFVMEYLPPRARRILDLGCGTGMFLEELSKRSELVVGVDASVEMLKVAQRRAKGAVLVLADADSLPFANSSFDVVVSVTLLQNMPDPAATMREITRVLKRGGTAVVTSIKRKHRPDQLFAWASAAGLKPTQVSEIEGNEDVICVARK